ncbi:YHYH domain-containing protein [Lacrimispora sp.]|uniref:YHYH domain-containing protein n=1 Tax=Lacrimispora sp. TaxID=2719234 RepID=UPI0028B1B601|nr:YHYH domain-containing protein [Lacrimispora sp.]
MKVRGIIRKLGFVAKKIGRVVLVLAIILTIGSVETNYFGSVITAQAHSGRTDSQGGHRDNKNASGLGSYHYHHGYSAHLHPNGVCPYDNNNVTSSTKTSTQTSNSSSTTETKAEPTLKLDDYSLVFEVTYYYNNNADLQSTVGNGGQKLLEHFVNNGMAEGRKGSDNFDVKIYKENNNDLETAYGDNLKKYYEHFLETGHKENRIHN